ncbi:MULTISPECIES: chemotaxis protein CheA [Idiomarina]|jgi:two-component system chemotaxis sensor kinase CheA|uniref:chemotaxis protein CheA n=1 Tax=Idiomarina TaxID=135575 RepID=UPI0006C86BFE|nr:MULTISPECIES: chemotaxis protein CheA [Idiomarina]KPD22155.1 chemotaxis protein CheA [Idiomarina abyssalis]MBH94460.1 chemotaxis protein CheA [Idiomarina sp.]SFT35404.1 two-component system, chemotaxis family, sensor kinase CheA [Idiomarina abyssalis]HAS15251.1 chemotaxis protein CheA [Idiomarina abyssalis]|tara:strand:+ start:85954 stop:88098 length:2145 start_codon:yes stop_codon:yes gene_type:complete
MSFDMDEDILQDFLIEAGEILEQLSEQLVELENDPENKDLLNAIFRGFHTVKGGAGFLSLGALVDTCHGAENVFDTLRNGQRTVTSDLMDVILQSLDTINAQFAQVRAKEEPEAASPELLELLHKLSQPESEDEEPVKAPEPEPEPESEPEVADASSGESIDEIQDDEFEALLDELHGEGKGPGKKEEAKASAAESAPGDDNDEITDDEFESLLDELHGSGKAPQSAEKTQEKQKEPAKDDEITDDEFESLLDELHGSGKAPTPKGDKPAEKAAEKKPEPKPQAKPQPKPAAKPEPKAAAAKAEDKPAAAKAVDKKPAAPAPAQAETTVRVDTKRLDEIMNMVGELVLVRNRLLSLSNSDESDSDEMGKAISNLDVVTGDLQGAVMKTRMQPIKKVFGRFPRVVRDLARSLKKEINLEMYGEDTDLDKNLVEALADPLVHLVRNSVDHGIEMPDVREANGKPRAGTVTLSASQEGDHIMLSIKDDGAGMDAEKLKGIAISKGILDTDAAARLSDEDAYNLIFAAGFSTKEEVSDISGRGVGMDVVKTKISQLNGSVKIQSELGKGTELLIKVPLTLAILPTLMVAVKEQTFALPLAVVSEIIDLDMKRTNTVDGQLTLIVRDRAIPLFFLEHWLVRNPDRSSRNEKGHVVVVQIGNQQVGFVVNALIGQEEVVIKPLDKLLQGTPGMAGATITSDGGIALIVDVPSMLKYYAKR